MAAAKSAGYVHGPGHYRRRQEVDNAASTTATRAPIPVTVSAASSVCDDVSRVGN